MEVISDRNGLKWRVAATSLATWKVLRRVVLRRSPRSLFKVVGYLRFSMAVMGEPRWKLGRISKSQSRLGLVTEWDEEVVPLTDFERAWGLFDALVNDWERPEGWKHRLSHVPFVGNMPLFAVIAVDATPLRWAVNVLNESGAVPNFSRAGNFSEMTPISIAEAVGSSEGLASSVALAAPVIALCNDNRGVGRDVWKGFSAKDHVDVWIETCTELLVFGKKAIVCVDTPTDENYADIDTRPTEDYSPEERLFRRQRTYERAIRAVEIWRLTGKSYFGREDISFEDGEDNIPEYESEQD